MQDTIYSGASSTLIKNGQSLISNTLDLTQGSSNSQTKARIQAAQRQIQHLNTPQRPSNHSMSQSNGDELLGSFLTMSKSSANQVVSQYQAQINEIEARERLRKQGSLAPISETDSNQYRTLDSHGQTVRYINPAEERKLTGKGTYDLDAYKQDEDDNYSSDEFESDDESDTSILTDGCSGSTADSSHRLNQAHNQANQQRELEKVVQAYNMILENTVTTDQDLGFSQYQQLLENSSAMQVSGIDVEGTSQSRRVDSGEHRLRTLSHSESQPINIKPMSQRLEEQKQYIAEQMGREVYSKVLRILQIHKQNDSDSADI